MNKILKPRVFLSASIPLPERDPKYCDSADPLAIRDAIRALVIVITEENGQLIFGGHPAITPMIRLQLYRARRAVGEHFVLYQSKYFEGEYPDDNAAFERVIVTPKVDENQNASLKVMREAMLEGPFDCAIFVGGMDGVETEYKLFRERHADIPCYPVASTGAAAELIFQEDFRDSGLLFLKKELSYLTLMRRLIAPDKTIDE